LSRRFLLEHRGLAARIDQVRDVADGLRPGMDGDEVVSLVRLRRFLEDEVLPHEEAEDAELYPVMAKALGGSDPTSTMSRGHAEIAHLVHKFGRVVEGLPASGPDDDDVRELRTILYGLHAVLRLHFAQEDEEYFSLVEEEADGRILAPGTSVAG
jgi:hemerythrin-like domain-containing protein